MNNNITEINNENINHTQNTWIPLHNAVMGRKHYRQNIPCQDACLAANTPRPYIVACDGRGSASKSHFGANNAVESIKKQMTISESILHELLDKKNSSNEKELLPILKDQFFRAAAIVQKELAETHNASPKDFEFTLIIMILGKYKGFYLHIGDGSLVIEKNNKPVVLSKGANGEFANITYFVQYGKQCKSKSGLISVENITGIAAFSDGTAEKMIEAGTGKPAPGFIEIWKRMRTDEFKEKELVNFLTRPDWEPKVQDDRCLALLSKKEEILPEKTQEKENNNENCEKSEEKDKELKPLDISENKSNKGVLNLDDTSNNFFWDNKKSLVKEKLTIKTIMKKLFLCFNINTTILILLLLTFFIQLMIIKKIYFK